MPSPWEGKPTTGAEISSECFSIDNETDLSGIPFLGWGGTINCSIWKQMDLDVEATTVPHVQGSYLL